VIKSFLLLLLLALQLFASQYNSTVFELEAKLFPKIVMLSEDIKKESEFLTLCIIAKEEDFRYAQEFKEAIEASYPDKLMNKSIVITIKNFNSIESYPDGVIVLNNGEKEVRAVANWANANKIVSLSYDPSYLEYDVLASIYIGRSVKPYLNREVMQKHNFNFNPYLLELSKFR
jgi:hypothetical protein